MRPIKPVDANCVFGAPAGMEDRVVPLHVYRYEDPATGTPYIYSLWEPNEQERTGLLAGLPVMLVIVGRTMPPVNLEVGMNIDRVTATEAQRRT